MNRATDIAEYSNESVGRRRPATKAAQREASVEKLLAAALRLFVSRGYRHTTVERIGEAAGLTKGSVYFYFRNKEGLLAQLFDRVEAVVVDDMEARVAAAGESARGRLVAFVHGQATLGVARAEHVLLLILMSLEFDGRGDAIESRIAAIYRRLYDAVEAIIDRGKERGEFRADIGTKAQAAIVMAGHDGTLLEWYRRRNELDGAELVRALRTSMLGGLLAAQAEDEREGETP